MKIYDASCHQLFTMLASLDNNSKARCFLFIHSNKLFIHLLLLPLNYELETKKIEREKDAKQLSKVK